MNGMFILIISFFRCVVRCDSFLCHSFLDVFLMWNSIIFWCDLILVFHDLVIVGDLFDLLFICLLFDCFAMSIIFHILGFFHEYFIQFIYDLFIIKVLWDFVVQMSGWIEICSHFVWFSGRNYRVKFIIWIRIGVSLLVVNMLCLFFGI
ncbi:hypothetical protein AMTRI_Chr04g252360 [Amborella trichopoda]